MANKGRRKTRAGWRRLLDRRFITPTVSLLLFAGLIIAVFFNTGGNDAEKASQKAIGPAPVAENMSDQLAEGDDPIGDLIAALPDDIDTSAVEPTWRRNAVAAPLWDGGPAIVVVIDDVGHNEASLSQLLDIKAPLTLSFLTYVPNLRQMTQRASAEGFELLVHLPMQPVNSATDPGIYPLDTGLSRQELMRRIDWHLSQFDGYVGFNNHMGSRVTADHRAMKVLMGVARDRGLIFLDSRTTAATVGRETADQLGVPALERDIFIDNQVEKTAILEQLRKAESLAQKRGYAVVVGHPYRATIDALKSWTRHLDGVTIVPLSALIIAGRRAQADA